MRPSRSGQIKSANQRIKNLFEFAILFFSQNTAFNRFLGVDPLFSKHIKFVAEIRGLVQ